MLQVPAHFIGQDRGADLTDLCAFLDPNDNSKVVLIMGTQGFIVSGEHFGIEIFDPNIRYRFEIENTGDAKPDTFLDVVYSPGIGRLTSQMATITLPDVRPGAQPLFVSAEHPRALQSGSQRAQTLAGAGGWRKNCGRRISSARS